MPTETFVSLKNIRLSDYKNQPQYCAAILPKGRCTQHVRRDLKAIEDLQQAEEAGVHDGNLDDYLYQMAQLCLCRQAKHAEKRADDAVEHWKKHWKAEIKKPLPETPIKKSTARPPKSTSPGRGKSSTPSRIPPITFRLYRDKSTEDLNREIVSVLNKRIEKKDLASDEGYIYVLWHDSAPGKYKVGHTKKQPDEQRLLDHERCYPGLKVLTYSQFPHPQRFEQLILKEFGHKRYEHLCHCETNHNEWVEATQKDIKESIDFWFKFAHSGAYLSDGYLNPVYRLPPAKFSTEEDRWRAWILEQLQDTQPTHSAFQSPVAKQAFSETTVQITTARYSSHAPAEFTSNNSDDDSECTPGSIISRIDKTKTGIVQKITGGFFSMSIQEKAAQSQAANPTIFDIAKGVAKLGLSG